MIIAPERKLIVKRFTFIYTHSSRSSTCLRCLIHFIQIVCALNTTSCGYYKLAITTVFPYPWPCFQFRCFWLIFHLFFMFFFRFKILSITFCCLYVSEVVFINRQLKSVLEKIWNSQNCWNAEVKQYVISSTEVSELSFCYWILNAHVSWLHCLLPSLTLFQLTQQENHPFRLEST